MSSSKPVKDRAAVQPPVLQTVKSILISLLRQPQGIVALLSDEVNGVVQPALRQVELAALDVRLFPQAHSLLADWFRLQATTDLRSVWPAFWRVFWMTVPDAGNASVVALPQARVPRKPVATAAHPRAFRGTKYQPPKPAQPVLDLCHWLADARLLDAFFARHDFTALPVLDAEGQVMSLAAGLIPSSATLYLHHWNRPAQELPVLPEAFRRCLLWQLRACSADLQLAWLQIWHQYGGMHADDIARSQKLAVLARLCAMNTDHTHAAELALLLPENRQTIFLTVVMREVQGSLSPQQMTADQLMRLHDLTEDNARFELYLRKILCNLSRQVNVEYSMTGCLLFEMSGATDLRYSGLTVFHDCTEEVADIINLACERAGVRMHLSLWRSCCELPGLASLMRETSWHELTAQTADTLINVIGLFNWMDDDADKSRKWREYMMVYSSFHALLLQHQAGPQEKLASLWYLLTESFGTQETGSLKAVIEDALPLMAMLSQEAYSCHITYGCALTNLINYLPAEMRSGLRDLNGQFWSLFERACRREDNTRLLAFGIFAMAELAPALLWQGMQLAAPRLFHTLSLLGSLHYERRLQFMRGQILEEYLACDWAALAPLAACQKILSLSEQYGLDSPLPRRLRLYIESKIALTDAQVQRHCALTLRRLPAFRLRVLELAIWQDMDRALQIRGQVPSAAHALRLLAGLDRDPRYNRKGLQSFLREVKAGKPDSYRHHPLNLAWHAAHPLVDKDRWEAGLHKDIKVDGKSLRLTFEQDPFEILKLGTYAGSCLSIGGFCSYSAVACLLDANKRVIYARNEEGRVIARQLVAIDEKDRLFCCEIYPSQCSPAMKAAFKSYDHELAEMLDIEMYREEEGSSYEVATILAECWWDDGPWQEE
ncbi:hypothetical protein UNDKW_3815 [Undibacterium sp. KW1]|uniref:hypothetical protein n=1 Tax=Undibacterium sp. KW1 TaxID=2058624 RepID=UPI001331E8B1|nr:hypothetical protein [Undibacterium sp. KW1]BBB62088.1 hypothetical protein UNDKW_3815 [Undibacterium sp. KW1]